MKNTLRAIMKRKQNSSGSKPEAEGNQIRILMAGALIGTSFDGLNKITKSVDLAIGVLRTTAANREKTLEAAEKAGFAFVLEENDNQNYCVHKTVKGIDIAAILFDPKKEETTGQLEEIVAKAKADGADFTLVYAAFHGKNEAAMAKRIAEAGADYVCGYGRKKTGPYNLILTRNQRKVPVIYNMNGLARKVGNTVLMQVNLEKKRNQSVQVASEGYYPCYGAGRLLPMDRALKMCNDTEERILIEEALLTVKSAMGAQGRCQCYAEVEGGLERLLRGAYSAQQQSYEMRPILPVKQRQCTDGKRQPVYHYDATKNCYVRRKNEAEREAVILCAGLIEYGMKLEADAECFGNYEFLKSLKTVANCFAGADLVIGNLSSMASKAYPSTGQVSLDTRKAGYANCRIEFVEALQKAGFTSLAIGNPYNKGLGIDGIFDTAETVSACGLIPAGIGKEKNPIVELNGIKIGLLSATTDSIGNKYTLTEEASDRFLNLFDEEKTEIELAELRKKGAEFVLAYVNCGMNKRTLEQKDRAAVGERLAEMGVDYVICTGAKDVSAYYRYETKDGRKVPIATSLGYFITGKKSEPVVDGALLKVFVRRTFDGSLELDDNYIPIRIFGQHEGIQHAVMPAQPRFNKAYSKDVYRTAEENVADAIGAGIKRNCQRVIKLNEDYTRNFTIAELYAFFGQTPTEKDLERLGDRYHQQIPFFTIKAETFQEGCVAILYDYINYGKTARLEWDIQTCIDAGVALVIDNQYHEELPCIVVEEPLMEVYEKLANAVFRWYHPVKVVITGSMGKTTTKEMTVEVFNNHFKTLTNGGNANVIYQIGLMGQKLQDDDGAYVQEAHGGTIGMASAISRMVEPDICILTNIEKNHMSQVGTLENLIKNKVGIIDGLKENGVLIACKDNEFLRDLNPPVRMIQYSVSDESCHYYGKNIRVDGDDLCFDIVVKESEFDHAGVYAARIHMQGEHNVGNAIAAFAAGRQAGIPPHKIIAGLSRYRTKGIRQNIVEHNGIQMILDTHNSNPKALLAMFDVLNQMSPKEGGRKVLVLGMMGEQGENSAQIHYDTGKAICDHDFDILFCYGEDAKYMAAAAKERGKEAYYFEDRALFNKVLAENLRAGDVVLVKGSHSMELDVETMVPIFGKTIRQH